jgi:FtsP/CotA-like multicopper oxidase with cupredoxin domain
VDLQLLFKDRPQMLGVVALDGAPLNQQAPDSTRILWYSHITLPPGARVEFIMKTPAVGVQGSLVTRMVDTGPAGENDPTRPLVTMVGARNSRENVHGQPTRSENSRGRQNDSVATGTRGRLPWLGDLKPVPERKLYFYEEPENPTDPNSPTKFYITVDGEANRVFDMAATTPNMTVQQGDVEDWVIENRTRELHAFHIHQTHFLLTGWNGVPLQEPYLRDIVNVPYWDGVSPVYPSVKLRMDFRDAAIAGTFVYHCHLLEHEDGGMMGTIRVLGPDSHKKLANDH